VQAIQSRRPNEVLRMVPAGLSARYCTAPYIVRSKSSCTEIAWVRAYQFGRHIALDLWEQSKNNRNKVKQEVFR